MEELASIVSKPAKSKGSIMDLEGLGKDKSINTSTNSKFQFMNVRYQLVGRGITGEILNLHVNGQKVTKFKTIDEFYNDMGQLGWEIRPLGMEQEQTYTYFVVMQRKVA
jgi:hypothetical protein